MSNKKKTASTKIKEPVKIRFKQLANGNKSIYLAHWSNDLHKWQYEFLKDLYIVPDGNDAALKTANDNTLKLAKAIQSARIVELQNDAHGFTNNSVRSKVNIVEYIKALAGKKRKEAGAGKRGNYQSFLALVYHIQKYSGDKTTFKNIDKRYCDGFLEYLKTATRSNA